MAFQILTSIPGTFATMYPNAFAELLQIFSFAVFNFSLSLGTGVGRGRRLAVEGWSARAARKDPLLPTHTLNIQVRSASSTARTTTFG